MKYDKDMYQMPTKNICENEEKRYIPNAPAHTTYLHTISETERVDLSSFQTMEKCYAGPGNVIPLQRLPDG